MYRLTPRAQKARQRGRQAAAARSLAIQAGPAPDYPAELPNLRRTVIVIDRDFSIRVTRLDLWKTSRVDSYLVHVDGVPWQRMGWSKVLEKLRLAHVRVRSARSMA
jgi:hypothetical protein